MKGKSFLVSGRIPPHTECPFRGECGIAQNNGCRHKGKEHTVPYSCASARFHDMFSKGKEG